MFPGPGWRGRAALLLWRSCSSLSAIPLPLFALLYLHRNAALKHRAFGPMLALTLAACEPADPVALQVGPIGYSESELLGLSDDRRVALAELTALGLAVADSAALAEVHRPLLEQRARERLERLARADAALAAADVDDEVLEARYRTAPRYELTVRHLLIVSPRYESDATRAAARAKAERALARIRAGEDLAPVAAELSEEPGAEGRQGLLTPGREGSWVGEFWNAALALEPGEVSGVVETQYGFHVLRLEDREIVPFTEVRDELALEVASMLPPPDSLTAETTTDGARALDQVPESWLAGEVRSLEDRALEWARLLRFARGMSPPEVKAAALEALAATGQNASVARDEVRRELGDALRRAYPFETAADDGS